MVRGGRGERGGGGGRKKEEGGGGEEEEEEKKRCFQQYIQQDNLHRLGRVIYLAGTITADLLNITTSNTNGNVGINGNGITAGGVVIDIVVSQYQTVLYLLHQTMDRFLFRMVH